MDTPSSDISHVPGDAGPTFKISRLETSPSLEIRDSHGTAPLSVGTMITGQWHLRSLLRYWWRNGRKL